LTGAPYPILFELALPYGAPILVIFAQGMTNPILAKQNTPEVGVAREADSHEIPGLTLVPVGRGPDVRHRRHFGIIPVACRSHLQDQLAPALGEGEQVIYHLESLLNVIDGRDRGQEVELKTGI